MFHFPFHFCFDFSFCHVKFTLLIMWDVLIVCSLNFFVSLFISVLAFHFAVGFNVFLPFTWKIIHESLYF